jgi:hypothetical protein
LSVLSLGEAGRFSVKIASVTKATKTLFFWMAQRSQAKEENSRYNRFYLIKNIILDEFLVDLFSLGEIGMLSWGRRNQFWKGLFFEGSSIRN